MVVLATQDSHRAVELLHDEQANHLMGEGQTADG